MFLCWPLKMSDRKDNVKIHSSVNSADIKLNKRRIAFFSSSHSLGASYSHSLIPLLNKTI